MSARGGRPGVTFRFGGCWIEGVGDDGYLVRLGIPFSLAVSLGAGDFPISRLVIDPLDSGSRDG